MTKNNYYVKNLNFFLWLFIYLFIFLSLLKGNNSVAIPNGLIETLGIKLRFRCLYSE